MKLLQSYKLRNSLLGIGLLLALTGGCVQGVKKNYCPSLDDDKKVEYLMSGKVVYAFNNENTSFLLFNLDKPFVSEYADAPSRHAQIVSFDCMAKKLKQKEQLNLDTVISHPEKNEVIFANTHKVEAISSSVLEIAYRLNTTIDHLKVAKSDRPCNLRFLSIGEGEDFLFFSRKGATISKQGHGSFKLVIKNVLSGYGLTKKGKKLIPNKDLKDVFNSINNSPYHLNGDVAFNNSPYRLNGDIALPSSPGSYLVFEIESIHFNSIKKTLTVKIKPLNNKENMLFFKNIKNEVFLKGPIDFHIDPWYPSGTKI